MPTIIRPYADTDLAACRALWEELTLHHRDLYDDAAIGGDRPGLYFDQHLARVGVGRLWVAEVDDAACGLTGLIVGEDEAEIEPVIVSAAHRGRGIGTELLRAAIAEARRLGLRHLSIAPVARNDRAIAMFARAGFDLVGRVELFMELGALSDRWCEDVVLGGQRMRR